MNSYKHHIIHFAVNKPIQGMQSFTYKLNTKYLKIVILFIILFPIYNQNLFYVNILTKRQCQSTKNFQNFLIIFGI
jgi:hypothetical protein